MSSGLILTAQRIKHDRPGRPKGVGNTTGDIEHYTLNPKPPKMSPQLPNPEPQSPETTSTATPYSLKQNQDPAI